MTVIGVKGDSPDDTTIFTAYGGPPAEREPGDKSLSSDEEREAARAFWRDHALVLDED